jgi:hypothetical protein
VGNANIALTGCANSSLHWTRPHAGSGFVRVR